MRVMLVHNEYGAFSGEEAVVQNIQKMLEQHGHRVILFMRSSSEIARMRFGKIHAFFSGVYSFSSKKTIHRYLKEFKPDIVHVHNLFPLISPSVLGECRRASVPVVMTVHNYRLVCPNGLYMIDGQVCEKCSGGCEYWCILRNCEKSLFKSLGYALRNYVARRRRLFLDNVTVYAALTEFQRQRLIRAGFPVGRIAVIPNMADSVEIEATDELGKFVGYVGRISPEKDLPTLMEAARSCSHIQFKAAGIYDRMPHLLTEAPKNFEFCGHLDKRQLSEFYANSRVLVLCSICYEGFPSVLLEAMLGGKPVICSRIGGLPEIVDDRVNGLLFQPGNVEDLAEKIRCLWNQPDICRKMGQRGREKALGEYSQEKYYEHLMAVYKRAIKLGPGGPPDNFQKDFSSSRNRENNYGCVV